MVKKPTYLTAKVLAIGAEVVGWTLNAAGLAFAARMFQNGWNIQSVGVFVVAISIGFGLILSAQIIKAQVHTAENTARLVELFERWTATAAALPSTPETPRLTAGPTADQRTEPKMRR
jgi:hypothetical protein